MSEHQDQLGPEDEPTLPDGTEDLFDLDTPPLARVGGRFTLEERLGSGGGAVVWRGYDEVLERTVAVKLLRAELAADPDAADRLRREAAIAARVPHPGIVGVYDAGTTDDGLVWIALEPVDGPTLLAALRHHPDGLPPETAAAICEQAAVALGEAHAAGLVHRDIKPANLLLSADGVVKIADFGIAVRQDADHPDDAGPHGTPSYAAPEQLSGDQPGDPRSDVFSLGVVLHECLTGRPAFPRGARPRRDSPLPPRQVRPDVPRPLDRLVTAATAADPSRRPADGSALALALRPQVAADPHALVAALVRDVRRRAAPQQDVDSDPTPAPLPLARRTLARIAGVALVLLVAAGLLTQLALDGGGPAEDDGPVTDAGVPVVAVEVFDPYGSISREPDDPAVAVDGDPSTAWTTPSYPVPLRSLGTPGVGLWIDLGEPVAVEEVELQLRTGAVTVELLTIDTAPVATTTEADWDARDRASSPGSTAVLRADGVAARYWLLWFTELEPVGESWQAALTDVRFRPVGTDTDR